MEINKIHNRNEVVSLLKELYRKGFRYVVRDKEMPYLTCFSLKPKRYRDTESWGYVIKELREAIPVEPIKNTDIQEIHWSNRSATLISDFLAKEEEEE